MNPYTYCMSLAAVIIDCFPIINIPEGWDAPAYVVCIFQPWFQVASWWSKWNNNTPILFHFQCSLFIQPSQTKPEILLFCSVCVFVLKPHAWMLKNPILLSKFVNIFFKRYFQSFWMMKMITGQPCLKIWRPSMITRSMIWLRRMAGGVSSHTLSLLSQTFMRWWLCWPGSRISLTWTLA